MIIGADYYESDEQREAVIRGGGVPLGVGANTVIRNTIVDKNARIGSNVQITNKDNVQVWVRSMYDLDQSAMVHTAF